MVGNGWKMVGISDKRISDKRISDKRISPTSVLRSGGHSWQGPLFFDMPLLATSALATSALATFYWKMGPTPHINLIYQAQHSLP